MSGGWLLLGLASRGLWFAAGGDSEFYSTRGQPEAAGTLWGQDVICTSSPPPPKEEDLCEMDVD